MALFLGLVLLILAEISLYVTLGSWIGLGATLVVVVGSAVLGVLVIRAEGQRTMDESLRAITNNRNPLKALGHGGLKALAGLLLILPGFLTDLAGLLLLVPSIRRLILRHIAEAARRGAVDIAVQRMTSRSTRDPHAPDVVGEVIDGTAHPVAEEQAGAKPHKPGHSGWTKN